MAEIQVRIMGTGPVGPRGEAGESAYEQALRGGYPGTEAEFNGDLANFKTYAANTQEGAAAAAASAVSAGADAATATAKAQQAETDAAAAAGSAAAANAAKTAALDAQAAAEEAAAHLVMDNSLSISGAAADAKTTGDRLTILRENTFNVPYTPGNMSKGSDGLIWLEMGAIQASSGDSYANTTGKYYKTQVGNPGSGTFLAIGGQPLLLHLGLDWVQWNCWSFSGTTSGTATHSNTEKKYISGTKDIYIPATPPDVRFAVCFRTLGASDAARPAFTDAQLTELKQALRFLRATDTSLSTAGTAADAKAAGTAIAGKADAAAFAGLQAHVDLDDDLELIDIPAPTYDGVWPLVSGGINPATGNALNDSNCRRIVDGGLLFRVREIDAVLSLGLADYLWTAWAYTDSDWTTGTRNLAGASDWISGIMPMRLQPASSEYRFCAAFRRVDGGAWTDADTQAITSAFRLRRKKGLSALNILFFGDSITRGRLGGQEANTKVPIPNRVGYHLGRVCENFGIGNVGWIAGYVSGNNKTNAIGYFQRIGDPEYYNWHDTWAGYQFLGRGTWSDFNTIVIALGTNDGNYPLGSLSDLDDSLDYAAVMAWNTSAQYPDATNRTIVKAMYQLVRWVRESEANHAEGEPYVPGGKYKRLILVDPLPNSYGWDYVRPGGYTRRQMSQLYEDFAVKYGLGHVQSFRAPIDITHAADYLPDNVHPNSATYQLLGRFFAEKILDEA